ncbi:MAG: helical backbone metal receptor [Thermoproteota archaeon]
MDKNITYIVAILAVVSVVFSAYGFINFQGRISDLEGELATIHNMEGQLDSIQEQITEYQEKIEEYQNRTLVDDMGNVVTFTSPPERIVSLSPALTEIVFAIGAGDNVVGVTDYCNYPYNFTAWIEAGNMSSIGSYYHPSTEPIVALEPDLVLAHSSSLDAAENLKDLGYNVLIAEGRNVDTVLEAILLVGRATYLDSNASALVTEMREKIDTITNQVEEATTTPKVYHELYANPIMSAGPDTFIDELVALAGGENIFHDASTSWPVVSTEAVVQKNPDVIFFPDMYMGREILPGDIEAAKSRPGWDSITAVQNDAMYVIESDIISRPGPRIVDALEALAKMIHPEIFGEYEN